ncbi:hypothetical protein [Vibrio cincinnatiensis]|jgi:hypothetical protein|uniref:hypothetical protein n=1 Tax=Vibrio cincinnatiensis TaxID=675 RepID=UPI001302D5BC|nr:hypothetical protein [Vibrio cincinnatiensis]
MKVICKVNNLNSLSDKRLLERLKKYISMPDGDIDLELGREYTVYGVVFWDSSPWYYICSEDYDEYPKPFAAEFFNVSDDRLSSHWKLSAVDQGGGEVLSSLVFDEWAKDFSFYERLIEDDPEAVELFGKYRQLMNQE